MGIDRAFDETYQWLLTMDQDSFFDKSQIKNFFFYAERKFSARDDIAIICPQHSIKANTKDNDSYKPVIRAITSGSLVNVEICKKLGGFDAKLFIDEVDFEYCYRALVNGFKIYQFEGVFLNHQIGKTKKAGYLSYVKSSNRVIHSPTRIYFMVRNHFYVASKYSKYFPKEFNKRRKELLVSLKNNLLFSGLFFKVLSSAWKGYVHYKQNKFTV
jgi:rhamnosyltransferase